MNQLFTETSSLFILSAIVQSVFETEAVRILASVKNIDLNSCEECGTSLVRSETKGSKNGTLRDALTNRLPQLHENAI